MWFVKNRVHTISIGQSTHLDLLKKSGLLHILFGALVSKKIWPAAHFFPTNFLKQGCIWFQVSNSVYQFIGGENDFNSNIEWSQRHNLYQTVSKKVSNNKSFVKANLLEYKSHNIISIPKQFTRNNV